MTLLPNSSPLRTHAALVNRRFCENPPPSPSLLRVMHALYECLSHAACVHVFVCSCSRVSVGSHRDWRHALSARCLSFVRNDFVFFN
jgi:hypothetical protein